MKRRSIVALPGDGIGRVVLPEALRVLLAAGFDAEVVPAEIGWECWRRDGEPLPARTVDLLAEHRLGLLGAITSKPPADAQAELPDALRARGLTYTSPILSLRRMFDQDICIRPCRSWPGNPTNFVRRNADGSIEEPPIDIAVFRQNTEGLYTGVEWRDPPSAVRRALAEHPLYAPFRDVVGPDLAISVRIVTRRACRRILEAAFRHARKEGIEAVTLAEKPNVLRATSGLFEEVGREVQTGWPDIRLTSVNIDALLMQLARRPEDHRVIVASNLLGDLVSDAVAGLTGGLGFASSASLGPEVSVFEPAHGSAPRHAHLDPPLANPIAAILAGASLAEAAGRPDAAATIRAAVGRVVAEGRVRTYDMLRLPAGPDAIAAGAASTSAMTDAVIGALGRA
ncbi:MAG TPA: isocitrate/isopropylmalate family dehydrogenase [Candidatus Polarisedimenticolaceae bacterium]|nr:isocitrate/isopropylmalate family dehydrogenase [Candidatus Polarisedimenticolaceae bacterium]